MGWCKKIFSIQINISQRKSGFSGPGWPNRAPDFQPVFRLDEKDIFINGKPEDNWMKNEFNSEYTIDISDFQFLMEKGVFHIFGEFFTSEINFLRNDAPDVTACVLALGKKAGQSICPEHESFQNYYFWKVNIDKNFILNYAIFHNF